MAANSALDRWQVRARAGVAKLAWDGVCGRCACSREECVGAETIVMAQPMRFAKLRAHNVGCLMGIGGRGKLTGGSWHHAERSRWSTGGPVMGTRPTRW
jgi:hypothetical protein